PTFPNFIKGDLKDITRTDNYGRRVKNTIWALAGRSTMNFDTHTPIIFNKNTYLKTVVHAWESVMQCTPTTNRDQFIVKSLYGNQAVIPYIYQKDCKVAHPHQIDQPIFSTYPRLTKGMKDFLQKMYPEPSKYEATH